MKRRIVVIGTSAGGIEALAHIAGALPADFPAPLAIAMHMAPESPGVLPDILSRKGRPAARFARNGEPLEPGRFYVAPPDHHLLIEPGRARLSQGPRENRFRPAIDPLFRSAAQVYGPAAIGVILTGLLDDGAVGLWTIKRLGGTAVVQDPDDAMYPSMPRSALSYVNADFCVPLAAIPDLLVRLTAGEAAAAAPHVVPENVAVEVHIAAEEDPMKAGVEGLGPPSPIACPECHGVLRQVKENGNTRFRCHTGHAYSSQSLVAEINQSIETATWNAIRALQEGAILLRQFAEDARSARRAEAPALEARADELERRANRMRDGLASTSPEATR